MAILNATWLGSQAYTFAYSGINARWGSHALHIDVQPIKAPDMGSVSTLRKGMIYPSAFDALAFGRVPTISKPKQYVQASAYLNVTWQGANPYASSQSTVSGGWSSVTYIYPAGIDDGGLGNHQLRLGQQFINPHGFASSVVGQGYALHYWEYANPQWILDASWVGKGVYSPPSHTIDGAWLKPSVSSHVAVIGINDTAFGQVRFSNGFEYVKPLGFKSDIFGTANISNKARLLHPSGILPIAPSVPKVEGLINILRPSGFVSQLFGTPRIYNFRQYLRLTGYNAQLFGTAFMGGGVKSIYPTGLNSLLISAPKVVNTRANQTINLNTRGIAPIAPPLPNVSPRILYPKGILAWSFGTATVRRNPSPKGFTTDHYGTAWVSHSPRYLKPDFVQAFESGYAKVFDPTQYIRHADSPHIPGGIFGDIAIRNKRRVIQVPGTEQAQYGDWSNIFSNLIVVHAQSYDHALFGNNVIFNKTPSVIPKTWNSQTFGLTFVSERIRRINARGFGLAEIDRFGRHVLTKPPELFPRGLFSQAFGTTTISNRRRDIFAGGMNTLAFSQESTVWFRYRYVQPTGIKEAALGNAKIEHGLRTVLQIGSDIARIGTPTVWFRVRSITASSIFKDFESNHQVGGTQFIQLKGFIASLFGERIVPEVQAIYTTGFNSQGFSEKNQIELHTRWVRTTGFATAGQQPSERYGTARVWNKRQYVQHVYDSGDGLNPPGFGQWTAIQNRNRVIGAIGFNSLRVGYHQIDNHARPLLTFGLDQSRIGQAMIADRIRHLKIQGMDAPYISGWGRVFNAAAQIVMRGDSHNTWGKPSVINTRREYRWVGAFESMLFGAPMVAFRIRKLAIESRYSIGPIYLPIPKVHLHTRYIDPLGINSMVFGGINLHIKWNTFTPRWTHRELFGDAIVRNRTPELKQRGNNSEVFGVASLRTQWRPLPMDGYGAELWGRANIAYRDRSISINGFNAFKFGLHKVIKTGAPPYSLQNINLDWAGEGEHPEGFDGNGIEIPKNQVPPPNVKSNVLFTEGFVATLFGSHHIQSNGILVYPGIQEMTIGEPTVTLKNRVIEVPTMGDLLQLEYVKPRLSPHTIYAVNNAPSQAIKNHPTKAAINYINEHGAEGPPGEIFGRVRVTLQHRKIVMYGQNQLGMGQPELFLRKRYITPIGFLSFRMGWHHCLDGSPQTIVQYDSEDQALFGETVVKINYKGPQYLKLSGFNASVFGANKIEFFNRAIYPKGYEATLMGRRVSGDTPYKPQALWVGRPMPTIPDGFNAEIFGSTTISLRVRDITSVGFDSFISEMDISNFKGRMKVELVKKPIVIEPKEVFTQAFVNTGYGVPDIRLKTHYIRPDGNSDQFRKGGLI